jgi:hypothetical protein
MAGVKCVGERRDLREPITLIKRIIPYKYLNCTRKQRKR